MILIFQERSEGISRLTIDKESTAEFKGAIRAE